MLTSFLRPGLHAVLLVTLTSASAPADVWDPGDDAVNGTTNQILPGSQQQHNLIAVAGTADEDFYWVHMPPRTSWEFVMEAMGFGVVGPGDPFTLVDSNGNLIANSTPIFGPARSLTYENGSTGALTRFVRAISTGCTTTCGSETVYQFRAWETTLAVPRFNNSATQTTFIILQNRSSDDSLSGNVWFLGTNGLLLGSQPFTLSIESSMVLNTSTVAGVAGQAGSAVITHSGRYGHLDGKAISLEPGTGFTFDTPVLPKTQ